MSKTRVIDWNQLSRRVLDNNPVSRDEAMAILSSEEDELLAVLDASFQIRKKYWGRGIRIHVLENAKSGMCRENCSFCSQAIGSYSGVDRYKFLSVGELVEGARNAYEKKAVKYCIVTATRGPSESEMGVVCEAVQKIKNEIPIEICTSLGLLTGDQADRLAAAGVDRFNHNLETSERFYSEICQTHTYQDRVDTIQAAKKAGMEACCGGIMGMGETHNDRVELAFALRELEIESIPVNFLDPREGTPLADCSLMEPAECLRCLAMFRFVNPTREIRVAGGREVCLKHLQPLALYPANSLFSEGYLTTTGQGNPEDMAMIQEAGFYTEEMI